MPVRSLLQFVLLIALVFAPICSMGGMANAAPIGAPTAEHHAPKADAGHCADMGGGDQDDQSNGDVGFDCRMACAGVLTPTPLVTETQIILSVPQRVTSVVPTPGRNPTAEPPPPRLS
ncbi:hypothetical protein [Sphingomonas jejuensis]|nr:hypothetical protein [Sphingomonas jejuensis]